MKIIKTDKKFIPSYETGSNFSEIAKYLRSQINSYQPQVMPKGMTTSAYALQAGALGAQMAGLAGQRTEETPFIPNATDVNTAFQKVPLGATLDYTDNFLLAQQNSLGRSLANSGMASYDVANALAGTVANAGRTRSATALDLRYKNNEIDQQRGAFNMKVGEGITAAENLQRSNENQKLAMMTSKTAEGVGAFGNLNKDLFERRQMIEAINSNKMSGLMNQLFTTNFYDSLYSKQS